MPRFVDETAIAAAVAELASAARAPARGARATRRGRRWYSATIAEVGEQRCAMPALSPRRSPDRRDSPRSSRPPADSRRCWARASLEVQHLPDARLVARRLERPGCRVEPLERLVVAALLARDLGERGLARRPRARRRPALGERRAPPARPPRRAPSRRRARRTLPSFSSSSTRSLPVDERRQPLEVVDRGGVRVCRLRRLAGAAAGTRASSPVLAVPVVVREQVELELDRVGLGPLDVVADALVQRRAERERHALVRDLLGDDVLEEVRLLLFAVERDEVERPQRARGARRPRRRSRAPGRRPAASAARKTRPTTLATLSVRRGASPSVSMRLRIRLCRLPGSSSVRSARSSCGIDALARGRS